MSKLTAALAAIGATVPSFIQGKARSGEEEAFEHRLAMMITPEQREDYLDAFIMLVAVGLTSHQIKCLAKVMQHHGAIATPAFSVREQSPDTKPEPA